MYILGLLFLVAATISCTPATASSPPPERSSLAPPAVLAAFARDTAVALGLVNPAVRDHLRLSFVPFRGPAGTTLICLIDPNDGRGFHLLITDDGTGPRAVGAWPM